MFFLIYVMTKWFVKPIWRAFLLEVGLCWAGLALPATLIASLTGHDRVARHWMGSLDWNWRWAI